MNPASLGLSISLLITSPALWALPDNYNIQAETTNADARPPPASTLINDSQLLHTDEATHLPTFLWSAIEPIPAATGSVTKSKTQAATIEQTARHHLSRYASLYRLDQFAQASARLKRIQPLGNNAHIVSFDQQVKGIEVYGQRLSLLLDGSSQLTAISGNLAPETRNVKAVFNGSEQQAIAAAFYDLHQYGLPVKQLKREQRQGVYQWYAMPASAIANSGHKFSKPVRIKQVLYPVADSLVPAYYLELFTQSTDVDSHERANYAYVISAVDGALLSRSTMTQHESAFTYRVWADEETLAPYDSPYGNDVLTPLISPLTRPVSPVVTHLITVNCRSLISTCDPWLPASATRTLGNNVAAYADLTAPNGFNEGDQYAIVNTKAGFDYGYHFSTPDDAQHPQQLQAAIVQAFYTTNFMHDWLYEHGFNEAAGNGQQDNFNRGGLGGDPLHVEVADYSDIDNASMTTPSEGASPTLQLFPWLHNSNQLKLNFKGKNHYYVTTAADFGQARFRLVAQKIVVVNDGVTKAVDGSVGTTSDGCETPFVNAADVVGAIALIDRGSCFFAEKAKNAQDAGAVAVLIANNRAEAMIPMGRSNNTALDDAVSLPLLGINQQAGSRIKQAVTEATVASALMLRGQLPPYNSALDNSIVIHEWGHFLSQRLVGLSNNQGRSLGEGWSDFLALLVMVKEQDQHIVGNEHFEGSYSIGQYVSSTQLKTYPFGIRRYPYSTDRRKNPLTFKHISNGIALPATVPAAPGTDRAGTDNAEVHNSGEVWASMLWDAYALLLNEGERLSFSDAQQRMLDYLVTSLKMTPHNPTFLEARDALLAVAKARDLKDYEIFWRAFAQRGAGVGAKAPGRYSTTQTKAVESFSAPKS